MARYMNAMSCSGRLQAHRGQHLTHDELRALPTIFKEQAWQDCSDNFRVIPTIQVLEALEEEGYVPTFAQAANSRIDGKADFTRHLLRLRHRDHLPMVGKGLAPELILLNGNDRTCSYQLRGGIVSFLCLNGLWTCDEMATPIKVRHSGKPEKVRDAVIQGTYTLIDEVKEATERTREYAGVPLSADERRLLATQAMRLRWDDPEKEATQAATPEMLLLPRRREETGTDLLTTYDVVQENVVRGAHGAFGTHNYRLSRVVRTENNRHRRATVREMTGIDQLSSFGRALAGLVEGMAILKAGGSISFN